MYQRYSKEEGVFIEDREEVRQFYKNGIAAKIMRTSGVNK